MSRPSVASGKKERGVSGDGGEGDDECSSRGECGGAVPCVYARLSAAGAEVIRAAFPNSLGVASLVLPGFARGLTEFTQTCAGMNAHKSQPRALLSSGGTDSIERSISQTFFFPFDDLGFSDMIVHVFVRSPHCHK